MTRKRAHVESKRRIRYLVYADLINLPVPGTLGSSLELLPVLFNCCQRGLLEYV